MSLPSTQLDAFYTIAQMGSFSQAATILGLTQSALSQKLKHLEEEIEITLFIRNPNGVTLTEQGQILFKYCQTRNTLEEEVLKDLSVNKSEGYSGVLRIAAYSSIYRSVLIPSFTPFLKSNPDVKIEFSCHNMDILPQKLLRAEADFIIMDREFEKKTIVSNIIGKEKYVHIESKAGKSLERYLDNDMNDNATEIYLKAQKKPIHDFNRAYFNDCYGIIDGVENALGKAVMPEHLIKNNKKIKISKTYKPMFYNVYLHYFKQPFYTALQKSAINLLTNDFITFLK